MTSTNVIWDNHDNMSIRSDADCDSDMNAYLNRVIRLNMPTGTLVLLLVTAISEQQASVQFRLQLKLISHLQRHFWLRP